MEFSPFLSHRLYDRGGPRATIDSLVDVAMAILQYSTPDTFPVLAI